MTTHHCHGCNTRYDADAYQHHFANDHCNENPDGTPHAATLCDRHRNNCPMHDPEHRHLIGGWNAKKRDCNPIYVLRAGTTNGPDGTTITTVWLTLGTTPPTKEKPNAPRPPAAIRGRSYHSQPRHLEPR